MESSLGRTEGDYSRADFQSAVTARWRVTLR